MGAQRTPLVCQAWTLDRRCKSSVERVGSNHKLKATARAARPCGEEALGVLQHRTQVKPRTGRADRVSVPGNATPKIQPRSERYWGRERQYIQRPYPGRSAWVRGDHLVAHAPGIPSGRPEEGNNDQPMPMQKSDLFVVAWKPVKAGGAKGEMD